MIRLIGGLVGSALAIALLLLLVGLPQFRAPDMVPDTAVVTLPLRTSPVEPPETAAGDDMAEAAALVPDRNDSDASAAVGSADTGHGPAAANTPDSTTAATAPGGPLEPAAEPPDAAAMSDAAPEWYVFWSPFRSELAATGFVARLQSVTGLDYRIEKLEPGVYEVAFAYRDAAEITDHLSRITAATGLELASR